MASMAGANTLYGVRRGADLRVPGPLPSHTPAEGGRTQTDRHGVLVPGGHRADVTRWWRHAACLYETRGISPKRSAARRPTTARRRTRFSHSVLAHLWQAHCAFSRTLSTH